MVRSHTGKLIEAKSKCVQGRVQPELAEAMGIRETLSWIKQKKVKNVELEADCLQMVRAIRSSVPSFSYLGQVVEEFRTLLAHLKDQNVLFRFVKRFANAVAHYLARYSSLVADRSWQDKDIHPALLNVMLSDLK